MLYAEEKKAFKVEHRGRKEIWKLHAEEKKAVKGGAQMA